MYQTRYIIGLAECQESHRPLVGGKNTGLGTMIRKGLPVPPGFAVTTEAFKAALLSNGLQETIQSLLRPLSPDDTDAIESTSKTIRALIEEAPIPSDAESAIRSAYRELSRNCLPDHEDIDLPVAVRSSATAEDLPGASFAGQQDTYLWVIGEDEVTASVRRCWSSLFTGRAISYRMEMNFQDIRILMSACVQKMVNARTAGVMFSLNPINGDRSKVAIDASWGLGEAVAAGEVTPDNYLIDKITLGLLRRTVSRKDIEYRPNPGNRRVEKYQVDAARRDEPSLTDDEAIALARYARQMEKETGHPLDLEWAIDRDLPESENIVLLQSRAETVWSSRPREPVLEGGRSTMDNIVARLLTGVKVRGSIESTQEKATFGGGTAIAD